MCCGVCISEEEEKGREHVLAKGRVLRTPSLAAAFWSESALSETEAEAEAEAEGEAEAEAEA